MKERPIIFNSEMVNAILEGRKTQTRRVVKPQPDEGFIMMPRRNKRGNTVWMEWKSNIDGKTEIFSGLGWDKWKCPYGKIGDKLLASGITLEITNIRVERLQDISEEDAEKEGFGANPNISETHRAKDEFEHYWEIVLNKDWKANPFVWVIEFKVC
jgi:hypothetical protein